MAECDVWTPTKDKKLGVAIHAFDASNCCLTLPDALSLELGDLVQILEESSGWYRGHLLSDKAHKQTFAAQGIFPAAYVQLKPHQVLNIGPFETVMAIQDQAATEVTNVLKEWLGIWKQRYVIGDRTVFSQLQNVMNSLVKCRKELLDSKTTSERAKELRHELATKTDWGNRLLGLDLVPRKQCEVVDPDRIDLLELYNIHIESDKKFGQPSVVPAHQAGPSISGASANLSKWTSSGPAPLKTAGVKHVYMQLKRFETAVQTENFEILFNLFDVAEGKFLHETFGASFVFANGSLQMERSPNSALFLNLEREDPKSQLYKDLYLVARIYRIGKMLLTESSSTSRLKQPLPQTATFKRPYGCAVLGLSNLLTGVGIHCDDYVLRIYSFWSYSAKPDKLDASVPVWRIGALSSGPDAEFYQLHEFVARKQTSKVSLVAHANVFLTVRIIDGSLAEAKQNNPLLMNGVNVVPRISDANVALPGECKNELLLQLRSADFDKAGKSVAKNIEATIQLVDEDGRQIQNCFESAIGLEPSTEYRTSVLYHSNAPRWTESVKVQIPLDYSIDRLQKVHLRMLYNHCSTRDKFERKPIGFSFIPIVDRDGLATKSQKYSLLVYRCEESFRHVECSTKYLDDPWSNVADGHHGSDSACASVCGTPNLSGRRSGSLGRKSSFFGSRHRSPSSGSTTSFDADSNPNSPAKSLYEFSGKEFVVVCTRLSSSKLTESRQILALLAWKSRPEYVTDALASVYSVSLREIFSFLPHVLDTLFGLYTAEDGSTTTRTWEVFRILAYIFYNLETREEFGVYRSILDNYVSNHFSAAMSYCCLIQNLRICAEVAHQEAEMLFCAQAFSCMDKFIGLAVRSRLLHIRSSTGAIARHKQMDDLIAALFSAFAQMLASSSTKDQPKIALLSKLSVCIGHFLKLQTPELIARTVADILRQTAKLRGNNTENNEFGMAKLQFVLNVVQSSLFSASGTRKLLLAAVLQNLLSHLSNNEDEVSKCVQILAILLKQLHSERQSSAEPRQHSASQGEVELLANIMLERLVCSILALERMQQLQGQLIAALFAILRLMNASTYNVFIKSLIAEQSKNRLKDFLYRLFWILREVVKIECGHSRRQRSQNYRSSNASLALTYSVSSSKSSSNGAQHGATDSGFVEAIFPGAHCQAEFESVDPARNFLGRSSHCGESASMLAEVLPSSWSVFKMTTNSVILEVMQEVSDILSSHFLLGTDYDYQLWNCWFGVATCFLTQTSLQLERLSESKRAKMIEKHEDMRVPMAIQTLELWNSLGLRQADFIPGILGQLLEISLTPVTEIRRMIIPIFYDIIDCEIKRKGDFSDAENEVIDQLDVLVSEGLGDVDFKELFVQRMKELILSKRPKIASATQFVENIASLLEKLLDYRSVLSGDDNKDKRMFCILNLMDFCRTIVGKDEMTQRYIYKLTSLLMSAGHYIEAANALKLKADYLAWGRNPLPTDFEYPAQYEWQRKEAIYHRMINHYNRGHCWEKGLPLCKELCDFYEHVIFDYAKLASTLRLQADFIDRINNSETRRFEPEYFRVAFYGATFPAYVRNKVFVFRGNPYEKISAFTQRLKTEWPTALILGLTIQADDTLKVSSNQYLQISIVKPVADVSPDVPPNVRRFYQTNEVDMFTLMRPIEKPDNLGRTAQARRQTGFKDLWSERSTIRTESKLPGILCWSEVTSQETQIISPIQNACIDVAEKNTELEEAIGKYALETVKRRKNDKSAETDSANLQPFLMLLKGVIDSAVNGGINQYQKAFFDDEYLVEFPEHSVLSSELKALIWEQIELLEKGLDICSKLVTADCHPLCEHLCACYQTMRKELSLLIPLHVRNGRPASSHGSLKDSCSPSINSAIFRYHKTSLDWSRPNRSQSRANPLSPSQPLSNHERVGRNSVNGKTELNNNCSSGSCCSSVFSLSHAPESPVNMATAFRHQPCSRSKRSQSNDHGDTVKQRHSYGNSVSLVRQIVARHSGGQWTPPPINHESRRPRSFAESGIYSVDHRDANIHGSDPLLTLIDDRFKQAAPITTPKQSLAAIFARRFTGATDATTHHNSQHSQRNSEDFSKTASSNTSLDSEFVDEIGSPPCQSKATPAKWPFRNGCSSPSLFGRTRRKNPSVERTETSDNSSNKTNSGMSFGPAGDAPNLCASCHGQRDKCNIQSGETASRVGSSGGKFSPADFLRKSLKRLPIAPRGSIPLNCSGCGSALANGIESSEAPRSRKLADAFKLNAAPKGCKRSVSVDITHLANEAKMESESNNVLQSMNKQEGSMTLLRSQRKFSNNNTNDGLNATSQFAFGVIAKDPPDTAVTVNKKHHSLIPMKT